MNISKYKVLRTLFVLLSTFSALFSMELNYEIVQHALFSAIDRNDVNQAAFCLAAGASLNDHNKDKEYEKNIEEMLADLGPQGNEMRAFFARVRQNLTIVPPPQSAAKTSKVGFSFSSLCAEQYGGLKRLLNFGMMAPRALLIELLNSENENSPTSTNSTKSTTESSERSQELAPNLIALFLNDFEKFQQLSDFIPKDLRKYLAQNILRNHPIVPHLFRENRISLVGQTSNDLNYRFVRRNNKRLLVSDSWVIFTNLLAPKAQQEWHVREELGENAIPFIVGDISNDESMVAYAKRDGKIFIANAACGGIINEFDTKIGMPTMCPNSYKSLGYSLQFSKDDKLLLISGNDKIARLFSVATGECLYRLQGHEKRLESAYFHPTNSELVLTASADGTAKMWNYRNELCVRTFVGHSDSVNWAVFSHNGKCIATASNDKTICVWDAQTGNLLAQIACGFMGEKVFFTPDDTKLFVHLKNKGIDFRNLYRLYDLTTILELSEWLKSCTLEEALLLHSIYCLRQINSILSRRSFFHKPKLFNFRRCPHLTDFYKKFPKNVQLILAPYVDGIDLLSDNEEALSDNA